jgi:double-stranded uracil-DNA glycosylase
MRVAPAQSHRACSFAPVARADARVLILGSMPGAASLAAQQYYAHPHNQFWTIMGALCGAGLDLPYRRRLERLQGCGVALWDVFESCSRPGSLDAAIDHATAVPNDILGVLRRCPAIRRICCNGTTAYVAFRRHFGAELLPRAIELQRLPSTSPANASWRPARKLDAWRAALADLLLDRPSVLSANAPASRHRSDGSGPSTKLNVGR